MSEFRSVAEILWFRRWNALTDQCAEADWSADIFAWRRATFLRRVGGSLVQIGGEQMRLDRSIDYLASSVFSSSLRLRSWVRLSLIHQGSASGYVSALGLPHHCSEMQWKQPGCKLPTPAWLALIGTGGRMQSVQCGLLLGMAA